ncbi:hypothetical protein BJ742DRAFT_66102 [Cladochytrium replicatum]|nr:hypothetical protein BJ742DRAFT_66102 [Cladochytrium replicatum]
MVAVEDRHALQARINADLTIPADLQAENGAINPQGFSVFDHDQLAMANNIAQQLMHAANDHPDAPMSAVIDVVERMLKDDVNDNEAVRYALMLFVTHSPVAQSLGIKIPSLSARASTQAIPVTTSVPAPNPNYDTEVALNYWREDVNLNEHHEHWHIVYPGGGIPNPRNPSQMRTKDRQGELFVFMHQQMIARYNAERISNGIELLQPIKDLGQSLPGDVPDANLRYSGKSFSARKNGLKLADLGAKGQRGYLPVASLEQSRTRILEAIKAGKFQNGTPITADLLGSTLESNVGSVDASYYGNLHNMGHVIISYLSDPQNYQNANVTPGLMYTTRTAVRDPVFWMWHGLIDNLFATWQDAQPPNKFDDAPHVQIRKTKNGPAFHSQDVILVYKDVLEAKGVKVDDDSALSAWAEQTFGGANWDAEPNPEFSTRTLETEFRQRQFTNVSDDGSTETITYLYPREYFYFFRVENTTANPIDVTLRVSMAPAPLAEDRRAYFEMDKFITTIPASSKKVVVRRCDEASVIRKPAQKTVEQMDDRRDEDDGLDRAGDQYCDCGWPFNMLVPRGTDAGLGFVLSVLATDAAIDRVPLKSGCGSMSFCGAKDKYPDTREMGYPFNRPFPSGISNAVASVGAWAATDVLVKFNPQGFSKKLGQNAPQPIAIPRELPLPGSAPVSAAPHTTENTRTLANGDVETVRTEILPDGSRKTTRTIQRKVPKGTQPPWDTSKPGVVSKQIITDELGRKVEVTESIQENGVKKVVRNILPH